MRISVDDRDPGYCATPWVFQVAIQLDGQRLDDVVTADEEAGIVVRYSRSPKGYLVRDQSGEGFQTEQLQGTVVVECSREVRVAILDWFERKKEMLDGGQSAEPPAG